MKRDIDEKKETKGNKERCTSAIFCGPNVFRIKRSRNNFSVFLTYEMVFDLTNEFRL